MINVNDYCKRCDKNPCRNEEEVDSLKHVTWKYLPFQGCGQNLPKILGNVCVIIDSDDDNAVKFYNRRQIAFHRFDDDLYLIKHLTDDENGDIL